MRKGFLIIPSLLLSACSQEIPVTAVNPDSLLNFNWDVKPILSNNCFRCHGPDAEGGQEAGLRLDLWETAAAELPESPGKYAIVPGDPAASELIRRISSTDPDVVMPPPDTHLELSADDIDILTQWIEDGAEYQPHWSFVTPTRSATPETTLANKVVTVIDNFTFARLDKEGLNPSGEADRATLINRVSLDITGLPPTLEEVDAFVTDDSPDAYEKLVDKLLSSKQYAENMTRQWLDIARYANSQGYLSDSIGSVFYPWRDWVISAFDQNMPFDDFSKWQIAGDLIPNHTDEQLLATAFLRLGARNSENGIIDEEFLVEYAIERVDTIGTGYLALTTGCARCHDHRYDPISIKDYYEFSAFFSATNEPGTYIPEILFLPRGPKGTSGPVKYHLDDEQARRQEEQQAVVAKKEAEFEAALEVVVADQQASIDQLVALPNEQLADMLSRAVNDATVVYYPLDSSYKDNISFSYLRGRNGKDGPPGNVDLAKAEIIDSATSDELPGVVNGPVFGEGRIGNALYLDDTNFGFLGIGVGAYERHEAFSFDLWFKPAEDYKVDSTVVNHISHTKAGGRGYKLNIENSLLRFDMIHNAPAYQISVEATEKLPINEWSHITLSYDGSSKADGVKLYIDGEPVPLKILADSLTRSSLPPRANSIDGAMYGFAFGKQFQQYSVSGSALDEIRVFDRALMPIEVSYLHNNAPPFENNDTLLKQQLLEFSIATDPRLVAPRNEMVAVQLAMTKFNTNLPRIMVMGDAPMPRPTYNLNRGIYSDPVEQVYPKAFDQIFAWDENLPQNRMGLVNWLFDPDNPLTARVFVNRIWQNYFGRGLVETAEDFGSQGSKPSHPQLLDWLALEFIESGWDVKSLHKLIAMSATYRQSSDVSDELLAADPNNLLLARGVRQRQPYEVIRDSALFASGLLVDTIGGPEVFPYHPKGIWEAVAQTDFLASYPDAEQVPDDHHRRSMYSFVRRSALHPAMAVFDMPARQVSVARRRVSNTPLQALVMLNDPQFLEIYEGLAKRSIEIDGSIEEKINGLYRYALKRDPSENEFEILLRHYEKSHGWFVNDKAKAETYLSAGVAETIPEGVDTAEFAALASVARLVMNSPDVYSKR